MHQCACTESIRQLVCVSVITLYAYAQQGYVVWSCRFVSVCIDPLGTNENHLSCHISPTHIVTILEAQFVHRQFAAGVKVHHNTQHNAVFVRKETSLSFSLIKWLVLKVSGLFQAYILLVSGFSRNILIHSIQSRARCIIHMLIRVMENLKFSGMNIINFEDFYNSISFAPNGLRGQKMGCLGSYSWKISRQCNLLLTYLMEKKGAYYTRQFIQGKNLLTRWKKGSGKLYYDKAHLVQLHANKCRTPTCNCSADLQYQYRDSLYCLTVLRAHRVCFLWNSSSVSHSVCL